MTERTLPSAYVSAGRDHMRAAVAKAARIVEKRNTIPILGMVELESVGDRVIARATDMDMHVIADVEGGMPFTGHLLCPAHELAAYLKRSYGRDATIQRLDSGRVRVISQPGSVTFIDFGHEDRLPRPNVEEPVATVGLDREEFLKACRDLQPMISVEETRYYLNGIYIEANGDSGVRLVATDGHRLGVVSVTAGGEIARALGDGAHGSGIIVPRKAIAYMVNSFPDSPPMIFMDIFEKEGTVTPKDGEPQKVITKTWANFRVPGLELKTKLIDGTYPAYRRVVPDTSTMTTSAVINSAKLGRALEAITFTSDSPSRAIKLEIKEGSVHLSTRAFGEHQVEATVDKAWVKGAWSAAMGLNIHYLATAMTFASGDVEMFMTDVGSPVVLRDVASKMERYSVLMPMRLAP